MLEGLGDFLAVFAVLSVFGLGFLKGLTGYNDGKEGVIVIRQFVVWHGEVRWDEPPQWGLRRLVGIRRLSSAPVSG